MWINLWKTGFIVLFIFSCTVETDWHFNLRSSVLASQPRYSDRNFTKQLALEMKVTDFSDETIQTEVPYHSTVLCIGSNLWHFTCSWWHPYTSKWKDSSMGYKTWNMCKQEKNCQFCSIFTCVKLQNMNHTGFVPSANDSHLGRKYEGHTWVSIQKTWLCRRVNYKTIWHE